MNSEQERKTRQEMPIFTRSFDLLMWLIPASAHWPRNQRTGLTQRLLDSAFDLREALEKHLPFKRIAAISI